MQLKPLSFLILCVLVCLLPLTGCAPGLGNTFPVPDVWPPERMLNLGLGAGHKLRVEPVTDKRISTALVQINTRTLPGRGEVSSAAHVALERALVAAGAELSSFDPEALVYAELEWWRASVLPSMPLTRVDARAVVRVRVVDPSGKVVHSARYEASSEMQHPYAQEPVISRVLSNALGEALGQILSDSKFWSALAGAQATDGLP
jgi:hypothetical protein